MSETKNKILTQLHQRINDYTAKKAYRGVSITNRMIYRSYIQELQSVIDWIETEVKEEQGR